MAWKWISRKKAQDSQNGKIGHENVGHENVGHENVGHENVGHENDGHENDGAGNQVGQRTYGYDSHGRQINVTDARNGTTIYGFNSADQVTSVTTPAPGNGDSPQTTSYVFDTQGRLLRTVMADGGVPTNGYYPSGEVKMTAGSRTYPVGYSYDSQGRVKTMTNWSSVASLSGARVTTWNYNGRGFLTNKVYQGTNGPLYSYSPAGRLQTRTWARGLTTTYTNTALGDLLTVQSNGATVVTYGLDRVGRRTNIIDDAGNRILVYNDAGLPLLETNTSGTMVGIGLVYQYDQYLRKTNVQVWGTNGLILSHSYGFDAAGRLTTVSDGTVAAGYSYLPDSPLIGQTFLTNSGVLKNTATKTYDHLNRLLVIQTVTSKTNLLSSNYSYNDANQRKGNRLQDGSYWVYDYDDLGQVTSGKRYWEDGTPVAGQQFEYAFDDIGNRTSTKAGGDSSGESLRSATYGANLLNQYTNKTVPGAVDVMGIANVGATVMVNGQSAYRNGEYYQALVNVANSSTNVFQKITNVATLSGVTNQVSGGTIVPMANQTFRYDPDGNLTNDGVFTYIWDHENRLLLITNNGMAGLPAQKITITYDSQGRRIRYVAQTNNAGTFVNTKFVRYVYDGWNLLAELNGTNNSVINTYLWGTDLSGTLQGAGGAGGLVAVKNVSLGYHAPVYDGNANVVALVDSGIGSSSGTVSGSYEYGPFGEVIRASGIAASINPFRFSTKYQDEETGFLYYGYRYYNASLGRWLNVDPLGEHGGLNMQQFINNNPVNKSDALGLVGWEEMNSARQAAYQAEINYSTLNAMKAELERQLQNLPKTCPRNGSIYDMTNIAEKLALEARINALRVQIVEAWQALQAARAYYKEIYSAYLAAIQGLGAQAVLKVTGVAAAFGVGWVAGTYIGTADTGGGITVNTVAQTYFEGFWDSWYGKGQK